MRIVQKHTVTTERVLRVEVNGVHLVGQRFANETARVAADLRVVNAEQHALIVVRLQ